jgi:bla regulator protein BlaR1
MEWLSLLLWPIFEWVLRTTVHASIVVCLVLLVHVLLRSKAPGRLLYSLWLLLIIRMVTPWVPQSNLSLFNLLQAIYGRDLAGFAPAGSAVTSLDAGQQISGIGLLTVLPIVWLAGATALACYAFFVNFAFWARVRHEPALGDPGVCGLLQECRARMGIRREVRLIETDKVSSPSLLGFVRPRLLLPKGMTDEVDFEDLRHIFLHELAHLKHHDIIVGYVVSLLQILHWFNPLLWFAFCRMRADRELACDELVLSTRDVAQPQRYGQTIIGLVERFNQKRYLPAMVGIMENKSQLKRRIAMIARFRKLSKKWSLLAVLVIALIAGIALTNAKSSSKNAADSAHRPAPMVWATHGADRTEQSQPGAARSPTLGYGGYAEASGRSMPTTRAKVTTPGPAEADSARNRAMGYGGYGGNPESLGYGGYSLVYGGTRVKDTKESDSPDGNSTSITP